MNDYRNNAGVASAGGVAIDEGLRSYMLGVYNYMGLGIALTGAISFFVSTNVELVNLIAGTPLKWVIFAAVLGMGWFSPRIINGSKAFGHAMFWSYAVLWGLWIAPTLFFFQQGGAAVEIYKAFFITASVFGATSLYGYTTKKDLSGWATFLGMAIVGLFAAILLNFFIFKSGMMSFAISSIVVLVFSALTAYETQMVKSIYREGSATNQGAAIFGAFSLYGSFVILFIHILNILGFMRD